MNEMQVLPTKGNAIPIAQLAFKLHVDAYRACCNGMTNLAMTAFNQAYHPAHWCVQQVRKVNVIDICFMTSLRVANGIYFSIFNEGLVSTDALQTLVQKKRSQEKIEFNKQLTKKNVYAQFSVVTAQYLYEIIPRSIGEQLHLLPTAAEGWILFKLGYCVRYLDYQLKKKWHYQEVLAADEVGKLIKRQYLGTGHRIVHYLVHQKSLEPVVDFEHLFLNLFCKMTASAPKDHRQLAEAMVKSFAVSLSQQKEIDQYLKDIQLNDDQEGAFIARLKWHKNHHSLPKGLPDPDLVRLTKHNLQEKLDEALDQYLKEKIHKFLERSCPKQLKTGVSGIFYFLEGKDILVRLFSSLIAELGIKQLVDPHLFAMAILNGSGVETMDYELEGFGRDKRSLILKTGQKIMADSLLQNSLGSLLVKTFEESGLKHSPASTEDIFQKRKAKKELTKYISDILHKTFKPSHFQHPESFFKATREEMAQVPLVGTAVIGLHLLINGSIFACAYPLRNPDDNSTSLPLWMFQHLSGKKLTDFLAERIVDLIYHPSLRITLMQLVDILTSEDSKEASPQNQTLKDDLNEITEFLFNHFTESINIPFREKITSLVEHFSGDALLKIFLDSLQPKETSLLEKGITSLLPTLKELLLYTRVLESFRQDAVFFEGDAKFWEYFIRESLNQHIAIQAQQNAEKPLSLTELFAAREKIVDSMLGMESKQLRMILAHPPEIDMSLDGQPWNEISNETAPTKSDKLEEEFVLCDST